MKKNLLLLGVCLLLSAATSAYAKSGNVTIMAPGPVMNPPFAKTECSCGIKDCNCKEKPCTCQKGCVRGFEYGAPQAAIRYKGYIMRVQHDRATVYNALNLTDDQIKLREDIIKENNPLYEQKFDELIKESFKLKALKSAGASETELNRQRRVVKCIKKDIQCLIDQENKVFKKSLTREQRSKYAMIKKLERKDFKNACHQKDYYKANPQMRLFGNPKPCPCPIGNDEN